MTTNPTIDTPASEYASCQSHCCVRHGCKYSHDACPVTTGKVTQDFPCEFCARDLDEADFARLGEVGYTITLGLRRDDATMQAMPTDQQVAAAVKAALAPLTINGWILTRVVGSEDQ